MMEKLKKTEKLPEGWRITKLEEICKKITTGKLNANAMKDDGEYRFYTCAKEYYFIDTYSFDDEALLISGNGEYVGYVHYYKGKFNAYQRTYVLTDFSIDIFFVKYYLDAFLGKRINIEVNAGNTPFIRKNTIEEMSICFPDNLSEQRKIAEILETVDNAIEKSDRLIEKYKRIKQGLMQDLLTKGIDENGQIRNELTHKFKDSPLGRIPEEWEVVSIYDYVKIINGGTPSTSIPEYWNGEIPWLSVEDFNSGARWVFSSSKHITLLGLKKSTTRVLKKGMLIISARGTVGILAQIGRDMAFNQTSYGLDSKNKDKITNDFLYFALKYFIKLFVSSLSYGNVFDTITKNTFKQILIPLPSLFEQHRIVSILSQIDETIEKESAYKEKLMKLKSGLMEDLLTGKVRVNKLINEENEANELIKDSVNEEVHSSKEI